METLKMIRPKDKIMPFTTPIMEKDDMALLHSALIQNENTIIIVTQYADNIVNRFLEEVDVMSSGYVFFQLELDIDPINNFMVPKHRYATQDEKDDLTKRHIPFTKLPVLLMKDPIRRWYNFAPESIIAIERKDKLYFRICK